MSSRPRRLLGLFSTGLFLAAACWGVGPAHAACSTSVPFGTYAYVYTDYVYSKYSADGWFWALGHGAPEAGVGTDNGTHPFYNWHFTPALSGDWNAYGVDGCIDPAECMAVLFSDQSYYAPSVGYFSVHSAPGPDFDLSPVDFGNIALAPILRPTRVDTTIDGYDVELTLRLNPVLPRGIELDDACAADVLVGYELLGSTVPPGAAPAIDAEIASGWSSLSPVVPIDQVQSLTLSCTSGSDVYLGTRLHFDSGFATTHVSEPTRRIGTALDSDSDSIPDACDSCTDTDGDGLGDPGFPSNVCALDNCPGTANALQLDADLDGVGDLCDVCDGGADPRPLLLVDAGASSDQILGEFAISPDSLEVAFLAVDDEEATELFRSSTFYPTPPIVGNEPVVTRGDVERFEFSSDSSWLVYVGDLLVDEQYELFSVPVGPGPPRRLNPPLIAGGDVRPWVTHTGVPPFRITPDGTYVVYVADQEVDGRVELYSVPIDGSAAPTKLNGPIGNAQDVIDYRITPDGASVVYVADQVQPDLDELFVVPLLGGSSLHLSNGVVTGDVTRISISPDGSRVVYRESDDTLYSVPIGGGPSTKLTPPIAGRVLSEAISPDSQSVVYLADPSGNFQDWVFQVPLAGGPLTLLADDDTETFAISPDSRRVVYETAAFPGPREVFVVDIDGGVSTQLSDPSGFGTLGFLLSPDGQRVVYRVRAASGLPVRLELESAPIDGGTPVRLNGPMVPGGNVQLALNGNPGSFLISADSSTVVYQADQEVDEFYELYQVAIAGGPARKVSRPELNDGIERFAISPDGSRVLFTARPGLWSSPLLTGPDADTDGTPNLCDSCTDSDGDGVGNPGFAVSACGADNCPDVANADQADADVDGAGDLCDCAPLDPSARRPAAVQDLTLSRIPGGARLDWSPSVGADEYTITRGELSGLSFGRYGSCLGPAQPALTHDELEPPLPGAAFLYLVQGASGTCGVGELGSSALDGPRINLDAGACH